MQDGKNGSGGVEVAGKHPHPSKGDILRAWEEEVQQVGNAGTGAQRDSKEKLTSILHCSAKGP